METVASMVTSAGARPSFGLVASAPPNCCCCATTDHSVNSACRLLRIAEHLTRSASKAKRRRGLWPQIAIQSFVKDEGRTRTLVPPIAVSVRRISMCVDSARVATFLLVLRLVFALAEAFKGSFLLKMPTWLFFVWSKGSLSSITKVEVP